MTDEFLSMLRCPENHAPLVRAPHDVVKRLNQAILNGQLRNRAGNLVTKPLDGLLVRDDGRMAYPIVDDIPILLIDEAVELDQSHDSQKGSEAT